MWNGKWENIEDNRGKEYWLDTDTFGTPTHTMKELGSFPANAVFTAPQKTLDELKADKINEFKFKRDSLEVEPISYQGYRFDYDNKARDRISAAIIALDVSKGQIAWTTADNTEVMVNADDLRGVIAAVALRSNKLHNAYRIAKEKVLEATTKEEVEKVVLNNG